MQLYFMHGNIQKELQWRRLHELFQWMLDQRFSGTERNLVCQNGIVAKWEDCFRFFDVISYFSFIFLKKVLETEVENLMFKQNIVKLYTLAIYKPNSLILILIVKVCYFPITPYNYQTTNMKYFVLGWINMQWQRRIYNQIFTSSSFHVLGIGVNQSVLLGNFFDFGCDLADLLLGNSHYGIDMSQDHFNLSKIQNTFYWLSRAIIARVTTMWMIMTY